MAKAEPPSETPGFPPQGFSNDSAVLPFSGRGFRASKSHHGDSKGCLDASRDACEGIRAAVPQSPAVKGPNHKR